MNFTNDLPTEKEIEAILKKNLEYTKPLEVRKGTIDGGKKLFPFWSPVVKDGAEVAYDSSKYLDERSKALREMDKVGSIKPMAAFEPKETELNSSLKEFQDFTIMGQVETFLKKSKKIDLNDMVGAVKVQKNDLSGTATSKQEVKSVTEPTVKISKVNKAKPTPGFIKPDAAFDAPKASTKEVTGVKMAKPEVGMIKPTAAFKLSNKGFDLT